MTNKSENNLRIVFLDIDGVLNSESHAYCFGWGSPPKPRHLKCKTVEQQHDEYVKRAKLNPSSVILLNELCRWKQVKVVITSTWRLGDQGHIGNDVSYWNTLFKRILTSYSKKCNIDVIDITPDYPELNRGAEIEDWLDQHPEVNGYVIIDDIDDGLSDLDPWRFHKIDDNCGFTLDDFHSCVIKISKDLK